MIKLIWQKKKLNFEKVEWSGTDTQASRQIVFTLPANPYDSDFKNAKIKLGDVVKLYDGKQRLFVGVVTSREKSAQIGTMSYTARDFMHYLLRSTISKVFRSTTPERITRQLCGQIGIKCGALEQTGVNINKLMFDDKSIYDIIVRAYRAAVATTGKRYMLVMDGQKLSVIAKGADSGVTLSQSKDITAATYSDTTDNMVNLVRIYNDSKKQIGVVENKKQTEKYGIYQSSYKKEKGVNAKKEAKSMLTGIDRQASIEAIGNLAAVSGKGLVIYDKATGLSGKFYIAADTHVFEKGVHTMSLGLAWKNTQESGADTESGNSKQTTKKHSTSAVAYYLDNGVAYHSSTKCSALEGKNPKKTTVTAISKIVSTRGSNKGKPKYKKCSKCWR